MLRGEIGESGVLLVFWAFGVLILVFLGIMGNNRDGSQRHHDGGGGGVVSRSARSSFRALSNYLRIVSSGASTVARSAVSVASSIVDRDNDSGHDQVVWAGFDKLEREGDECRRVLLLGYLSGFQVWDVEEVDNVHDLVSRHDGPVSFLQMLPNPIKSKRSEDRFSDSRPLLVLCADSSCSEQGFIPDRHVLGSNGFLPTVVRFYSLKSQSYVHMVKFRSVIYSVRCSSRIVAVSQAAQIHCFDARTLEKDYTILTNPVASGSSGVGYGPLAVGPRWLAYSGSPVASSDSGRVSPQSLTPSATFSGFASNGSLVAHYAKESSKQLAVGILTLGDMGYKKLSRYYSEIVPDSHNSLQSGLKGSGTISGHLPDADSIGMVIIRDIVSKSVISQFRAHKSPISALCFDPSGTLLVTASVQGHNINVFKIMPGLSGSYSVCDIEASSVHLYRLQRGFTNAVIQDISFSEDSNWIMISSSRGTSHLFAINHSEDLVKSQLCDTISTLHRPPSVNSQMPNQQSFCSYGPPVTLSAVSRIRNGNNGWIGTVSGAAAAATGRMSPLSGAIASSFNNCKINNNCYVNDNSSFKTKCHLLVFSPSGYMIQYALRTPAGHDSGINGLSASSDSGFETEGRLLVEAIQKWTIGQKQNRREQEDVDIYGENGNTDCNKIYPEEVKVGNNAPLDAREAVVKGKFYHGEKHQLYISEAELQMLRAHSTPLWVKPEMSFQSMVLEGIKGEVSNIPGGEIEIERIPSRMIGARSKELVPIFDYLQSPKLQQPRIAVVDNNRNRQMVNERLRLSENGRLSSGGSSYSLETMNDRVAGTETIGLVNNSEALETKSQPEVVIVNNSIERSKAQLEFVNNNNKDVLNTENHFEDRGSEFIQ